MKNPHCRSRDVKQPLVSLLLLASAGLLPCVQLVQAAKPDEKRSSAAPAAKAQSPAGKAVAPRAEATATRPALATVSSGKYTIAVENTRWAKGQHLPSFEHSGLPASVNFATDAKGSGGARNASGGSGGYSAGGSGRSGRVGGGSGTAGTSSKPWGYVLDRKASGGGGGWSGGGGGRGGVGGSGGYSAGGSGASGGYSAGGGGGTSGWSGGASAGGGSGGGFSAGGGSGGYGTSGGSSSSGGYSAGGSAAAGGSSGFSSSGGGASAGGASGGLGNANLVVDLRVSGPKTARNQILCSVIGKVQAKDDQGRVIDAPDLPAHLKMQLSGIDYPEGSGCAAVHLNAENENARSIESLAGELVVMDARIQTVSFEGRSLNTASTRQLIGVKVRLDKVESTAEGINVSAGVSMPNPFTDQLNFHNVQNRLRVVLEDSEGTIHAPRSMSGGGGGRGGGSSASAGGGGMRRGGGPAEAFPPAMYNLNFAQLPQGVRIKKITCTVTELLGTPHRVTFRFSDLPLPQAAAAGDRE